MKKIALSIMILFFLVLDVISIPILGLYGYPPPVEVKVHLQDELPVVLNTGWDLYQDIIFNADHMITSLKINIILYYNGAVGSPFNLFSEEVNQNLTNGSLPLVNGDRATLGLGIRIPTTLPKGTGILEVRITDQNGENVTGYMLNVTISRN